jgi:RNA polymerase sigma factor (sigma-70 family)
MDVSWDPSSDVGREPAAGSVTHLFCLVRNGEAAAFTPLWQHFFPRLVGLARKRLSGRPAVSEDAEDAAQAALASFWKQMASGDLLQDLCREGLWNLLATITVRKIGKQLRHDAAARRNPGRIHGETDLPGDRPLAELLSVLPTQELDLQAAELMEALPPELQELAMLRLLGHSTEDIATQLDCTRRKVQRKLELVRLRWESLTADDKDLV